MSHQITPRLRHVDLPICYLHHEQSNGLFEVRKILSRIQFANLGTKSESGPSLLRSSSIAMGHIHIKNLPQEQYDALTSLGPISCYKHFSCES